MFSGNISINNFYISGRHVLGLKLDKRFLFSTSFYFFQSLSIFIVFLVVSRFHSKMFYFQENIFSYFSVQFIKWPFVIGLKQAILRILPCSVIISFKLCPCCYQPPLYLFITTSVPFSTIQYLLSSPDFFPSFLSSSLLILFSHPNSFGNFASLANILLLQFVSFLFVLFFFNTTSYWIHILLQLSSTCLFLRYFLLLLFSRFWTVFHVVKNFFNSSFSSSSNPCSSALL